MILTPQHVLEAVAEAFCISTADIRSTQRTMNITRAREVYVGVCRFLRHSYPEITQALHGHFPSGGGRAETTDRWHSRYAPCERRWWVDHVRARYGIPSVDGLSGALAEKFRHEVAA